MTHFFDIISINTFHIFTQYTTLSIFYISFISQRETLFASSKPFLITLLFHDTTGYTS